MNALAIDFSMSKRFINGLLWDFTFSNYKINAHYFKENIKIIRSHENVTHTILKKQNDFIIIVF